MYRVLSRQNFNIYCDKPRCDLGCGLFHKSRSPVVSKSLRERRPVNFRVQSLDLGRKGSIEHKNPPFLSTSSEGGDRPGIRPVTPLTLSEVSTVTLDDIIASAKRKISQEIEDLRIPSPLVVHAENEQRGRSGSSPDPENNHQPDLSFVHDLVDSDDEDWVFGDRSSLVVENDQEDFDELLKDTKPPQDHYSNPLYREADPLNRRRRKNKTNDEETSSIELSVADISTDQFDLDSNFALLQSRLADAPGERAQYEGNL